MFNCLHSFKNLTLSRSKLTESSRSSLLPPRDFGLFSVTVRLEDTCLLELSDHCTCPLISTETHEHGTHREQSLPLRILQVIRIDHQDRFIVRLFGLLTWVVLRMQMWMHTYGSLVAL